MKSSLWLYNILKWLILVLIVYTLSAAAYHLMRGGFSDDPCFVNREHDCVRNETHSRGISGSRIQAFLNTTESGYRGGGCRNKSSSTDSLEMKTYGANIVLERKDDTLLVNGVALKKGAKFKITIWYHLDPWMISQVEFENLGPVFECGSALPYRRLVIMGEDSLLFSFPKGMTILTILITGMVLVSWKLKVKFLSAIPTILITYLISLPCMLTFFLLYRRLTGYIALISFLVFFFYCLISVLMYRKNVLAFWVMILSLLFSGLGELIIGIFVISSFPIVLRALFIIAGIYFIFGAYKLYRYRPRAGNVQETETS
jgi:hypothetical protein